MGSHHCIPTFLVATAICITAPTHARQVSGHAADQLGAIRQLWRGGKYESVVPQLLDYRSQSYGRNIEIDYMLATSMCALPDVVAEGRRFFLWILYVYNVDPTTRLTILNEERTCGTKHPPVQIDFSAHIIKAQIGVRGKAFRDDRESAKQQLYRLPLTSEHIHISHPITAEEFRERLFKPYQREAAKEHALLVFSNLRRYSQQHFQGRMSDYFTRPPFSGRAYSEGPFVLITSGNQTTEQLADMIRRLTAFAVALERNFDIRLPEYLVTIYLVAQDNELYALADQVHGLELGRYTIGYSVQDDLTINVNSSSTLIGTLKHELFHLAARNRFGDIPAWLDEGLASLCEESTLISGKIVGGDNWRRSALEKYWAERPSVRQLVEMDWQAFDDDSWSTRHDPINHTDRYMAPTEHVDKYVEKVANHAMSRYLVMFLQNKGLLPAVYHSMQSFDPGRGSDSPPDELVRRIESVTTINLDRMDAEFVSWFNPH